jgi:hypothetical protein
MKKDENNLYPMIQNYEKEGESEDDGVGDIDQEY